MSYCSVRTGKGGSIGSSALYKFWYSARVRFISSRDGFAGLGPVLLYHPFSAPKASLIFPSSKSAHADPAAAAALAFRSPLRARLTCLPSRLMSALCPLLLPGRLMSALCPLLLIVIVIVCVVAALDGCAIFCVRKAKRQKTVSRSGS
jgi:hypothetical protein